MGSVIDTIECPQCGGLYTTEYYYKTGEEYRHCLRCGRQETWVLIRGKDEKPIRDENDRFKYDYTLVEGLGSAKIAYKEGFAQIWSLSEPVSQKLIDDFLKDMELPEVDKNESYLSSWDPEKKELAMIYGRMPETFAEFNEENAKEEDANKQPVAVNDDSGT